MRPHDTSEEAHEVQLQWLRRLSPEQRLERGASLCAFAREARRAGIRARHPEYSESDVEAALLRTELGDDALFRAAWPHRPFLPP